MDAASKIRLWREGKGLSQTDLAKKLGLTQTAISLIELRERLPSLSLAERIEALTGIPMRSWMTVRRANAPR